MRSALIAAWLVLAMAGTAASQPGMTVPSSLPPPPTPQHGEELSESTAVWLSLGGAAASWTLVAVAWEMAQRDSSNAGRIGTIGVLGTLFAPSAGHWYARSFLTRGLGLRVAGVTATFLGLAMVSQCDDECSDLAEVAGVLAVGGAGLYIGGTIDDIAAAPGKVLRYNQRFQSLAVAPMIRGDSSGLMIVGRF
jgi:hypothetical protein